MNKTEKEINAMEQEAGNFDQIIRWHRNEKYITSERVNNWIKLVKKYASKIFTNRYYVLSKSYRAYKKFEKISEVSISLKPKLKALLKLFYSGIFNQIKKVNLKKGKYSF